MCACACLRVLVAAAVPNAVCRWMPNMSIETMWNWGRFDTRLSTVWRKTDDEELLFVWFASDFSPSHRIFSMHSASIEWWVYPFYWCLRAPTHCVYCNLEHGAIQCEGVFRRVRSPDEIFSTELSFAFKRLSSLHRFTVLFAVHWKSHFKERNREYIFSRLTFNILCESIVENPNCVWPQIN